MPILPEEEPKPVIWVVHVSKSKDLSISSVNKAIEEYSRLPKSGPSSLVTVRLEFIMSQVATPRKSAPRTLKIQECRLLRTTR